MADCKNCAHQRICDLWSQQESQDASCFDPDCFEPKQEPVRRGHIYMQERISCTLPACSCCGGFIQSEKYAFCPWCGAKLDE